MRLFLSLAILTLLLNACGPGEGSTFEGKIDYKIQIKNGNWQDEWNTYDGKLYIMGENLRLELRDHKDGDLLEDLIRRKDDQDFYLIDHQGKKLRYSTIPDWVDEETKAEMLKESSAEDTFDEKEILGYPCKLYEIEEGRHTKIQVWATDYYVYKSPSPWDLREEMAYFFHQGIEGIPLKIKYSYRGRTTVNITATGVSPESMVDSYFALPKGYERSPYYGR